MNSSNWELRPGLRYVLIQIQMVGTEVMVIPLLPSPRMMQSLAPAAARGSNANRPAGFAPTAATNRVDRTEHIGR